MSFLDSKSISSNKRFDYAIAGSGVAGNVCSYLLQKKGYSCIILEKESQRNEKICGGGVPGKALKLLNEIGMDLTTLYNKDISEVVGDCVFWGNEKRSNFYAKNDFAIGCQRKIFDDFLLTQAVKAGANIAWGEKVSTIRKYHNFYNVNGFLSEKVVVAVGARGLIEKYVPGQSIGISAQILGNSKLRDDFFYFFYYDQNVNHYFWIFPIGEKRWNIGLWHRFPSFEIKSIFTGLWEKIIEQYFLDYTVLSYPKGEFCGNIDLRNFQSPKLYGIGDFAGCNNAKNGGGIYRAIKSVLNCVENEMQISLK